MTYPLPSGWQEKKIIDISEVTSSKRIYEKEYVKNGVPFYRGKEISLLKNKEKIEEVIYISEEKYTELKNKYGVPQKNDILITAVGTIGNAYMVDNNDPFYFKDGNLIWLKNIKEHPKFLTFLFEYNQNKIIEISMGSSQKALTIIKLE
ncbi:restriction endonuclease subunit S, partial [Brachyspira intermedia]|uniref:restriction endonuclease subunit S n=1 Tax=Brachyspira intermedia TaxID=84377 RepID=UPI003003C20E